MKSILGSLLLLLSVLNCGQENMELLYVAQTRGFFLKIVVKSKVLTVISERDGEVKERELSELDFEELKTLLAITDLDDVKTSTSSKSTYDAAAMASLNLSIKGKSYQFDFDHGNPPKKLEALVNKIITLSEIVE
ncbi:hypothetical protein [Maribacter aestuarii]|uniref:hypothetical protein n=1 Tax=Maribacter aestuarii TaxID=1130723 RepID=UPI00248C073F|nr:hypothetical protein [Maribacter aestuarii]